MSKKNTLKGARALNRMRLHDNPDRYSHTVQVFKNCQNLVEVSTLTDKEKETLFMAAYLHDIGYSGSVQVTGFHPYDGYTYLSRNGWAEDICLLVLHHSEAATVPRDANLYLDTVYDNPLPEHLIKLYRILAIADMTADGKGNLVTFHERVADIKARHGEDSLIAEHSIDLSYKVVTWLLDLRMSKATAVDQSISTTI